MTVVIVWDILTLHEFTAMIWDPLPLLRIPRLSVLVHPCLSRKTRLTLTLCVSRKGFELLGVGLLLCILVVLTALLKAKLCLYIRLKMRWLGLPVLATYVAFGMISGLIRHLTFVGDLPFSIRGLTHFPISLGRPAKLLLLNGDGIVGVIRVLSCPTLIL